MKIVDARWETPTERKQRIAFYNKGDKRKKSIEWCGKNTQRLIDWHEEYSVELPRLMRDLQIKRADEYKQAAIDNNHLLDQIKSGSDVRCKCGAKMRFIFLHNFAGCSEYRNTGFKHDSYNYRDPNLPIDSSLNPVGPTYLTEFKKFYNIPNDINTSVIFKTLKINNVKLLCDIPDDFYEKGSSASKNSGMEEGLIKSILELKFTKIYYQQGIRIFDGYEWFTRIPDYICHNPASDTIFVLDAKKAFRNIDHEQLNTYVGSVQFISDKSERKRNVIGRFILADTTDCTFSDLEKNRCIDVTNIKYL